MGDRCIVIISVMTDDEEAFTAIADTVCPYTRDDDFSLDENICSFHFDEVNYADLGIHDQMVYAGIPYDQWNSNGDDYDEANESLRFDEAGKPLWVEASIREERMDVDKLISLIDSYQDDPITGYAAVRRAVKDFKASITPIPWETQHDNKRMARMNRLLEGHPVAV